MAGELCCCRYAECKCLCHQPAQPSESDSARAIALLEQAAELDKQLLIGGEDFWSWMREMKAFVQARREKGSNDASD